MARVRPPRPRHDLRVDADLIVSVHVERLLVVRVRPPDDADLRRLFALRGLNPVAAAVRWRPRWAGERLAAVEFCADVHQPSPMKLVTRFALPARQNTLARQPTQVVLLDPDGWEAFGRHKVLRRGLVFSAGAPAALAELIEPIAMPL